MEKRGTPRSRQTRTSSSVVSRGLLGRKRDSRLYLPENTSSSQPDLTSTSSSGATFSEQNRDLSLFAASLKEQNTSCSGLIHHHQQSHTSLSSSTSLSIPALESFIDSYNSGNLQHHGTSSSLSSTKQVSFKLTNAVTISSYMLDDNQVLLGDDSLIELQNQICALNKARIEQNHELAVKLLCDVLSGSKFLCYRDSEVRALINQYTSLATQLETEYKLRRRDFNLSDIISPYLAQNPLPVLPGLNQKSYQLLRLCYQTQWLKDALSKIRDIPVEHRTLQPQIRKIEDMWIGVDADAVLGAIASPVEVLSALHLVFSEDPLLKARAKISLIRKLRSRKSINTEWLLAQIVNFMHITALSPSEFVYLLLYNNNKIHCLCARIFDVELRIHPCAFICWFLQLFNHPLNQDLVLDRAGFKMKPRSTLTRS